MFRLLLICLGAALFSGCASLQDQGLFASPSEFLSRAGDALSKIGRPNAEMEDDSAAKSPLSAEVQLLFEQPYIDPLTKYLQQHDGDTEEAGQIARVQDERDRRCRVIADRYASRPLTSQSVVLYRVGYAFSCPDEVAAFAARVESVQSEPAATASDVASEPQTVDAEPATPAPEPVDSVPETASDDTSQQLNDCYLLTAIRNFSDALEACRQPAKEGNVRAQTNMAMMANALADYDAARRWALEAAPSSADAANLLGELYRQGNGVAQDEKKAEKWFIHAASLGHAGAKARIDDTDASIAATSGDHVH